MASVSMRYARAFADVVIDLKLDASQIRGELRSLLEIVSHSADLRNVWTSPTIERAQKLRLLDAIAQRTGFQTVVRNFMAVLIDHNRTAALPAIAHQFELEMDQRLGFVQAEIASTRELSAEEKSTLEQQMTQVTGRKVRARYDIDKSLLGGAVVRVGSTIYDGSVRGQLRRVREELSAG